MAKKPTPKKSVASKAKKTIKRKSSDVRNSPVPKKVVAATKASPAAAPHQRRSVTYEMVAQRAFEISQSGYGGGELDNWLRAERELHNS
ncbi:MAG TPA: DUF2934 domain-containing protein [Tepidisphaeraceae bacterium]|jgi:hypothetical protein|nr:DUF2934 domain-containing protein [Tepidisphaeraceae bacterium]